MDKIIVSLTSYKPRFKFLPKCIASLQNQKLKPDKIKLYLDKDDDIDDLPIGLLCYDNLDIITTEGNLKSHTKYFYAIREQKDELLITIDDDVEYDEDMLYRLYKFHLMYPDSVIANRVHRIKYEGDYTPLPYHQWDFECKNANIPSFDLFATGVGGILYPPDCMNKSELLLSDFIIKYCLYQDDIWLKLNQLLNKTKVVGCIDDNSSIKQHPNQIEGTIETSLYLNKNREMNDLIIQKLLSKYSEKLKLIYGGNYNL